MLGLLKPIERLGGSLTLQSYVSQLNKEFRQVSESY